jgi:hypothetical protein
VHLHHLVPGVIASLAAGTAIVAFRPGDDSMLLLSGLFGVGAALTLDEFALILHLEDVYWTREGRSSIEATLMGFAFAALCLLATAPLHSDPSRDVPHWVVGGLISVNMLFALVAFLKGKAKLGAFGVFVPGAEHRLDVAAGAQPADGAQRSRPSHALPGPRPRREVPVRLRCPPSERRSQGHPQACPGAERECAHGTLGRQRPPRVPRPDADLRSPSARALPASTSATTTGNGRTAH